MTENSRALWGAEPAALGSFPRGGPRNTRAGAWPARRLSWDNTVTGVMATL